MQAPPWGCNSCQNCMAKNIHCIYVLYVQGWQNDLLLSRGEDGSSTVRFEYLAPGRPSFPMTEVIIPLTELHDDVGSSESSWSSAGRLRPII